MTGNSLVLLIPPNHSNRKTGIKRNKDVLATSQPPISRGAAAAKLRTAINRPSALCIQVVDIVFFKPDERS